jgi:hypothetical protein
MSILRYTHRDQDRIYTQAYPGRVDGSTAVVRADAVCGADDRAEGGRSSA